MSNFQQIVLDHIEENQPLAYAQLVRTRSLRDYMNQMVDILYEETERIQLKLQDQSPEIAPEFHRIEAERIAIESILI